jgi:Na+-translocating ferredoxin:NAD+ oxidoreductase RnfG subunit
MSAHRSLRWLIGVGVAAVPAVQSSYAVQYLTIDQAQHQAFPTATELRPVAARRESLLRSLAPEMTAPEGWSPKITEARLGDRRLGWLIVDQVIGKTDAITFAVAIDLAGSVTWLEILEYREAHGSEVRLPAWRRQFIGKGSRDPVSLGTDIRNISGATLSCRHVTEGVRRALRLYDRLLRQAA